MIYPDNQTKHFYALKSSDTATVKQIGDNLRIILKDSGNNAIGTTDVVNTRHILSAKVNEVLPTYFRKWMISIPATVTENTTYYVYFYLENMLGMGIQDRWDRVASYTTKDGETSGTKVLNSLKVDLDRKLNGMDQNHPVGPIAGDFTVTTANGTFTAFAQATANDAGSYISDDGHYYYLPTGHTAGDALSDVTDKVEVLQAMLVVTENKNSSTYKFTDFDMRMHSNPYAYNVTMSTFDGTGAWCDQKEVKATNTSDVYISAANKVKAMELYFLRNRADLYDLSPEFNTSILNETNGTYDKTYYYYTLDVHYAFSDGLGFTYYSEKDLTIAMDNGTTHSAPSKLTTLLASLKPITDRVTTLENA